MQLSSDERSINTMEYTRTQEIKFGIEVPVCTSFAYRLFLSCEIAIAKIAGSTEQQMFKNEILSVFLITVTKSLEFSKIFLKYFSPTNCDLKIGNTRCKFYKCITPSKQRCIGKNSYHNHEGQKQKY